MGTWSPAFDPDNTTTYTFTPNAGECATTTTITVNIDAEVLPTFDAIPAQCEGGTDPLVTTSLEGIMGTWSPAFDPDNTTTYTFTPNAGECATTTTITVTIHAEVLPTFDAIAAQCEGGTDPLVSTSLEGIMGTWSPAFDPDNTTTYTFTPNAGECATTTTITVNIDAEVSPTFDAIPAQCVGGTDPLVTTSLEGIMGSWSPAFDPDNTTTYTFIPNACLLYTSPSPRD